MTTLSFIVFWCCLALLGFAWIGYPALIFFRAIPPRRSTPAGQPFPFVSLIIPAHNEESIIHEKLQNSMALEYPANRMEIIVVSDGSTDRTEEIAIQCAHPSLRLLCLDRGGKNQSLNIAASSAQGDILVFSDADSMIRHDGLIRLITPFADPAIGGVAGNFYYTGKTGSNAGEYAYWSFDRIVKILLSKCGNITSATGQLYAIRKELFRTIPQGLSDDFFVSACVVQAGRRLVFAPDAIAWGPGIDSIEKEFRRKIRVSAIGFRGVWELKDLCNPARYGFYAIQIITQKILRRLVIVPLLLLLISNLALYSLHTPLWGLFLLPQLLFHSLALVGWLSRSQRIGKNKWLALPCAFDMAGIASIFGFFKALKHQQGDAWTPHRPEYPVAAPL